MAFLFRNAGAWGAGLLRRLTSLEVDGNWWTAEQRFTALESGGLRGASVSNIAVSGSQVTFFLDDGTTFGPFNLPYAVFTPRGNYAAGASYAAMDLVFVPAYGLVLVLQAHTAPDVFNPDLTSSGGDVYQLVLPVVTPANVVTVTAANLEPGPSQAGSYFRCTNSSGCLVTLTTGFATNDELHFRQAGAGPIAFMVGDTGGVINAVAAKDESTDHIGAVVTAKYLGDGAWDIFGDLADATA